MSSLIGIFKKLGNLKDLLTLDKTNLVFSINEVVTNQDNMKQTLNNSVQSIEAGSNYNTIKVTNNDGTVDNVVIRVQGGASTSALNVFRTAQSIGSYIATEQTDTFTVADLDDTKDIDLIYNNFLLVRDIDYTVDKSTGTIGLSFELKVDEVIYYVLTNTSYDYNDLDNLPDIGDLNNLNTTSKEVVGAINELESKIGNPVESISAGASYNTIKVVKSDGTEETIVLNIQGGGGSSDSLNVFRATQSNGQVVLNTGTTTYTIDDLNVTKDILLIYKNLVLVENADYTVNKSTGTITTKFDFKNKDVIYYVLTGTSYDYNDLANLPNIGDLSKLNTTTKEVVGAINEVKKGALPLTGGTIKGNVNIEGGVLKVENEKSATLRLDMPNSSGGMVETSTNNISLRSTNSGGDIYNQRQLVIFNPNGATNVKDGLIYQHRENGTFTNYRLYGEHNRPNPTDIGATPLTHACVEGLASRVYNGVVISDWNDVRKRGIYMSQGIKNAPTTNWVFVEVYTHNDLYCTQVAYCFTATSPQAWMRNYCNGKWYSWSSFSLTPVTTSSTPSNPAPTSTSQVSLLEDQVKALEQQTADLEIQLLMSN